MFHPLRRGFVTDLFKTGADVDEGRKLARHRSVTTTLSRAAERGRADLAGPSTGSNRLAIVRSPRGTLWHKKTEHVQYGSRGRKMSNALFFRALRHFAARVTDGI